MMWREISTNQNVFSRIIILFIPHGTERSGGMCRLIADPLETGDQLSIHRHILQEHTQRPDPE